MRRNRIVAFVVVLLVVTSIPLIGSTAASSSPSFDVYTPENIVEPGEETNLELEIRNGASTEEDDDIGDTPMTEARDVTVELVAEDAPVEVKTGETPLPRMPAQRLASESFTIAVDENAAAGTYELEAEIEYTYTRQGGHEHTTTTTETVEVVVEERARFDAVDVQSDLVVGDRGLVTLELNNTGVENASDAVVQFDSPDPNVQSITPTTDESELRTAGSEEYVGDWSVNETATVQAAMDVDPDAVARTYPVSVTVDFRDSDGVDRTSREVRVGAKTAPEQRFAVETLETDLYVGEDGTIEGTVLNDGPKPVESAVLVVDDGEDSIVPNLEDGLGSGSNVYPRETQYAIGDLKPGESVPFEFRVGIGGEAEPGPRVMEADVRYRNVHDDIRMTHEPIDVPLEVAPERDEFDIEIDNGTQEVGETQPVTLQVTNAKAETVTDVEAKLYTNDPLDNLDDEGFIPTLEPGESATVTFEVEVDDDATPQTYPLRMDFRYDDERSNSQLTDTYRIPLEVQEPESRLSALSVLLVLGFVVGATGVYWRFQEPIDEKLEGVPVLEQVTDLSLPASIQQELESDAEESVDADGGGSGDVGRVSGSHFGSTGDESNADQGAADGGGADDDHSPSTTESDAEN
ncbi:COG1361 S-layer family protein [Natronobacterium gregoryi]|uniref:S-layer domain-containing protein n=2 Tax=Natronobacterium gregoryi TaxID=44930 RepID=L0AC64_NATGS|nr:COG1361 S-layer family protein [Natronobacterium gregoryi]AFZ71461.1 S-layer domain-containing protein [Natronobacterium gregoryi SP2]ELY66763.1 hypothetical protein C490_12140 [Natronobacterium gregoryi SP2]PLK19945.1 hypothetical protein CYV19_12105 [Natronobacterium gregoryi SP2]SFJ36305.1 Uncharacterized conserved protein [Natronobacterium gregoryi]